MLAREHVTDIQRLDAMIKTAGKRITEAGKDTKTSVTDVYGVGPINGALILGELGNIARFDTRGTLSPVAARTASGRKGLR